MFEYSFIQFVKDKKFDDILFTVLEFSYFQIIFKYNFHRKIQKMTVKLFIVVALLAISASSMYIQLNDVPFCFNIPIQLTRKSQVKFFYSTTSETDQQDDSFETTISYTSENGRNLAPNKVLKAMHGNDTIPLDTKAKICFESLDKQQLFVQFDFYPDHHSMFKKIAAKSDFYELHQEILDFADKLDDVRHNEEVFMENQQLHHRIINTFEGTMWNCSLGKVVLILIIMATQLFVLRRTFKKYEQKDTFSFGF